MGIKIGLLPLYIKLYDDRVPWLREGLERFYEEITAQLQNRGVEVVCAPFCRLAEELQCAIQKFEAEGVDAAVTLHMAYSPSLEAVDVLAGTKLPIVILDTTRSLEFTGEQDPEEINYCHGIHGVMDMCSMLARRGKAYAIAAGHYLESDCIDRVCGYVRAAKAARSLKGMRTGLIGGAFAGMGDFMVPFEELAERFGIQVLPQSKEKLLSCRSSITDAQIAEEKEWNRQQLAFPKGFDAKDYDCAVRSCLTLRRYLEEEGLDAFSVNFMQVGEESGLDSMPFLECCRAMSRGTGYAGEGDVLTASFAGALLKGWPDTNFVEIFCPDWKNNLLFLSHMGEVNYRVASTKPLISRAAVNYGNGAHPYMGYVRMKAGKGVYVNVSRGPKDYRLILAEAEMVEPQKDAFTNSMRGWLKPQMTTAQFLEALSQNGATHHSIFVYGAGAEELAYFGRLLKMDVTVLESRDKG